MATTTQNATTPPTTQAAAIDPTAGPNLKPVTDLRFVTKSMHAFLDYPVALSLVALPFLLQLGGSHPAARWLAVGTGVAAFVLTALTDHQLGVFRVLPYRLHLVVDALVGVLFLVAPNLLGFTGIDAVYYWFNGAAVAIVVVLHKPEPPVVAVPVPV